MFKKKVIGCFVIILLLTIIEGCANHKISSVKQENLENKIILIDDVWGRVIIDDKVTTSNVEYFVSKLQGSDLKPSDLILEVAIRAQLISGDSQKEMYFSRDWVYDGNVVYESRDVGSIYAILKRYLYSSKQLSEIVNKSPSIQLTATDTNSTCNVINKLNLLQALADSLEVSDTLEQILRLPPEYPFYSLTVALPNDNQVKITLISPEFFIVNDLQNVHVYSNGKKLWDYCVAIHAQPIPQFGQISYLFQANSIRASKWKWDLQPKKNYIIRALLESKEELNKIPADLKIDYEITFEVNGQRLPVQIYNDYFIFNGKSYYRMDIQNVLERIMSAG